MRSTDGLLHLVMVRENGSDPKSILSRRCTRPVHPLHQRRLMRSVMCRHLSQRVCSTHHAIEESTGGAIEMRRHHVGHSLSACCQQKPQRGQPGTGPDARRFCSQTGPLVLTCVMTAPEKGVLGAVHGLLTKEPITGQRIRVPTEGSLYDRDTLPHRQLPARVRRQG